MWLKAGVSISTASYALNDKPNVHPDTKMRVLKAAEELNYYPNAHARSLKMKKIITLEYLFMV